MAEPNQAAEALVGLMTLLLVFVLIAAHALLDVVWPNKRGKSEYERDAEVH